MPARAVSPAASENEIDIAGALAGDSDSDASHRQRSVKRNNASIPLVQDDGDDGSDDAEFIALTQAASNRKASNVKGRSVKKGGGFQAMGLNANLLKAITRKGFSVPTPIQRRAIPLVLAGRDVVGMARTGSGKTAAFVLPMLERLKAHSAQVGARALVLSPSRELALQTMKVVKELGRGTDLQAVLLVGGDSLEEQFAAMAGNPDVVIATPGRFLHLKVEMGLDLSSMRYAVFDEADRLFEMGFGVQLNEILAALPNNRQTLLFSATLPKSLVEFARAGLQEPSLVRLDAESKVSPDLQSAFFAVKSAEKEGALLHIVQDVIQIPTGPTEAAIQAQEEAKTVSKKRKRADAPVNAADSPTPFSTLVFAATKHHVDFLTSLLRRAGYATSHVYGALDQTARRQQIAEFRSGHSHIMVVTDVAARGIDIPVLANVINYDFPAQPKIFVHRVGRTARAGRTGWSYSLVADGDVPYLLDLQLFLGRRLVVGREDDVNYATDVVCGGFARDVLERRVEDGMTLVNDDVDLQSLQSVAAKGEKLYRRTRQAAAAQSAARAKGLVASDGWMEIHSLFRSEDADLAEQRQAMLARVSGFRPQETVFEIGKKGQVSDAGEVVRKRRQGIVARKQKAKELQGSEERAKTRRKRVAVDVSDEDDAASLGEADEDADYDMDGTNGATENNGSDSDLSMDVTIAHPAFSKPTATSQDASFFMSYHPQHTSASDAHYSVNPSTSTATPSASFLTAARSVTMDLGGDDAGGKTFGAPSRAAHQSKRWDKRAKKYVTESATTAENGTKKRTKRGNEPATIVGESGARLAASFRSGRFDSWMQRNRMRSLPRVGEAESERFRAGPVARGGKTGPAAGSTGMTGRFQHRQQKAPKAADPKRDDFFKQRKRVAAAKEAQVGRHGAAAKSEVKGVREVQKERALKEKRRERNGPGRKAVGGKRKGRK